MSIFKYVITFVSGIMTGVIAGALYDRHWRKSLDYNDSDLEYDLPTRCIYINNMTMLEDIYQELVDINRNNNNTNQIDIIIQSDGPLSMLWTIEVTNQIKNSPHNTRVFVDGYAHNVSSVIALSTDEIYLKKGSTLSTFGRVKSDVNANGYKGVINDKYDAEAIMNEFYHKSNDLIKYNKADLEELGIEVKDW